MKQILFQCRELSLENEKGEYAFDINMEILSGETIYLLGKSDSGKDLFFSYLKGEVEIDKGSVRRVEKEQIAFLSEKARVSILNSEDEGMTIVEYIYLFQPRIQERWWKQAEFERKVEELFASLALHLNGTTKISNLVPREMLLVDIVRCLLTDTSLILMEESFSGMSEADKREIHQIMEQIKEKRNLAFVINYDALNFDKAFNGQGVMFSHHTIIRKYKRAYECIAQEFQLIDRLAMKRMKEEVKDSRVVFAMVYENSRKQTVKLELREGTIFYLQEPSTKKCDAILHLIYNNFKGKECQLSYQGKPLPNGWEYRKEKFPIVVLCHTGAEGLYKNLSVSDNLLLPSLKKISAPNVWIPDEQIFAVAKKEWKNNVPEKVELLTRGELVELQLESWLIFNPNVLILMNPFWGNDEHTRAKIIEYLLHFRKQGCAILVVSSDSPQETEHISEKWFDEYYLET